MKVLIATANKGKVKEFKAIINELGFNYELITLADLNNEGEPIEDGKTFEQNAIIKAKYYYDKYHLPTLADDSGLCIEFFDNFPGIYSARFLDHLSYKEKNEILLRMMKNVTNRNASFHCVLAYINQEGNLKTYEGIINGHIADSQRGENGFGYDPIFCYGETNMSNAELPEGAKNEFSHRYIVIQKWLLDNEK